MRAAAAWHDAQRAKIARIGDNMREVAVTEGDKVEAQMRLGYSVNGYGIGDLVKYVEAVTDRQIKRLCADYDEQYMMARALRPGGDQRAALLDAARIEAGLRAFLEAGDFAGFTDTFEDLSGLRQLPGLAVQRLMADGYGFGAEGDWKHAALVRAMKVMSPGLEGGVSFMEDYTYHFDPVGTPGARRAHAGDLSVDRRRPAVLRNPSAGDRRQGRSGATGLRHAAGPGDQRVDDRHGQPIPPGGQQVDVMPPEQPLPKLPVARALWVPQPNLQTAAAAWILAGGAHHTSFARRVTTEHMEDYAEMADIELLVIDDDTELSRIQEGTAVERGLLLSAARHAIVATEPAGSSHHSTTY